MEVFGLFRLHPLGIAAFCPVGFCQCFLNGGYDPQSGLRALLRQNDVLLSDFDLDSILCVGSGEILERERAIGTGNFPEVLDEKDLVVGHDHFMNRYIFAGELGCIRQ